MFQCFFVKRKESTLRESLVALRPSELDSKSSLHDQSPYQHYHDLKIMITLDSRATRTTTCNSHATPPTNINLSLQSPRRQPQGTNRKLQTVARSHLTQLLQVTDPQAVKHSAQQPVSAVTATSALGTDHMKGAEVNDERRDSASSRSTCHLSMTKQRLQPANASDSSVTKNDSV